MDIGSVQPAITSRLPQRARWLIGGTPLDFSFYSAPRYLTAIMATWEGWDAAFVEQVSDLIAFGERDYAEGGGATPWLVVRLSDGNVFALDAESDMPLRLLNSSLEAFVNTFCLLHQYLGHNSPIPPDLHSAVQIVDPMAYPRSEWHDLVAALYEIDL